MPLNRADVLSLKFSNEINFISYVKIAVHVDHVTHAGAVAEAADFHIEDLRMQLMCLAFQFVSTYRVSFKLVSMCYVFLPDYGKILRIFKSNLRGEHPMRLTCAPK